jgi:hypothetical protein
MSIGEQPHTVISFGEDVLERMVLAVELVRDRLRRAAAALDAAGILYAVIGGNAIAAWVSKIDPNSARNTADVDFLLNRSDLDAAIKALEKVGFVYRHVKSIDMFLDGSDAKARDAVHVIFANERVKSDDLSPTPPLLIDKSHQPYRLLDLEPLVRMKLTSYRDKDRTHIRDLIGIGLIDESWPAKFPPELAARLQHILDTPDG